MKRRWLVLWLLIYVLGIAGLLYQSGMFDPGCPIESEFSIHE